VQAEDGIRDRLVTVVQTCALQILYRCLRACLGTHVTSRPTMHPEFELARWAANNMSPEARAQATVYTSGEHCPMCAAAHAWVGRSEERRVVRDVRTSRS